MRTQHQNPVFHEFKHLLPKSGLYPAKWVDIFSNRTDDSTRISEVEVVFIPREHMPDHEHDDLWTRFAAYNDHWLADSGNSLNDWLQPDGETPASIFGYFLWVGFASSAVMEEALREFAHIEECDWAREMLRAFENKY